jgi:hypothetical protein
MRSFLMAALAGAGLALAATSGVYAGRELFLAGDHCRGSGGVGPRHCNCT